MQQQAAAECSGGADSNNVEAVKRWRFRVKTGAESPYWILPTRKSIAADPACHDVAKPSEPEIPLQELSDEQMLKELSDEQQFEMFFGASEASDMQPQPADADASLDAGKEELPEYDEEMKQEVKLKVGQGFALQGNPGRINFAREPTTHCVVCSSTKHSVKWLYRMTKRERQIVPAGSMCYSCSKAADGLGTKSYSVIQLLPSVLERLQCRSKVVRKRAQEFSGDSCTCSDCTGRQGEEGVRRYTVSGCAAAAWGSCSALHKHIMRIALLPVMQVYI